MSDSTPQLNKKTYSAKEAASIMLGAAFLMGTSAVGPGFITQTTNFTRQIQASFGFAIIASVIIGLIVQQNIWRILAVSGLRGQDVANKVLPGLGYFLAIAVALGGLAFNLGNVAGTGMGLEIMFGLDKTTTYILSAVMAIVLFLWKDLGKALDVFAKILGVIMIALIAYGTVTTAPPVGDAVRETFMPSETRLPVILPIILTLVGGTVGGYISFSGAHRLIDGGVTGQENLQRISKGATQGILITGVMRFLLFLAVLGVVVAGHTLDHPANPAASVFLITTGRVGLWIFGVILWAAGITSIVGASYTSASFLRSLFPIVNKYNRAFIIGFIIVSTCLLIIIGQPVHILVLAGALNGFILPLSLGCVLLAAYRKDIIGDYRHPLWLSGLGWIVLVGTLYLSWVALQRLGSLVG